MDDLAPVEEGCLAMVIADYTTTDRGVVTKHCYSGNPVRVLVRNPGKGICVVGSLRLPPACGTIPERCLMRIDGHKPDVEDYMVRITGARD